MTQGGTPGSSKPVPVGGLDTSAPAPPGARAPVRELRDLLEGAIIVAAAVVVWVAAAALPAAPVEKELSSGAWPKALALALGVLGVALIVGALRGRVKHGETLDSINRGQWPMLAGTLVIIVAFLIAWPAVGFLASALVSFVLLSWLLGVGDWLRSAAWGVGLALVMWVLFEVLLNIPL